MFKIIKKYYQINKKLNKILFYNKLAITIAIIKLFKLISHQLNKISI